MTACGHRFFRTPADRPIVDKRDVGNKLHASLFIITDPSGIRAAVSDSGAMLVSLEIPDRDDCPGNVVPELGRVEDHIEQAGFYFRGTVGRFGNRVAGGRFQLDGGKYNPATNDPPGACSAICTEAPVGFPEACGKW